MKLIVDIREKKLIKLLEAFKNQFGFTYYKPNHFQFPPNNFNVKVTSIVTYIHTSKAL